jgi:hypothetical protein
MNDGLGMGCSQKSESAYELFLKHKHLYQQEYSTRYVSTLEQYDTADPLEIYTNNQSIIDSIQYI